MDNIEPLLSLCIPTYGKVDWIIPVIESIYAQEVDHSLFEVVITDNGGKKDLAEIVKKYTYNNFHYYQTSSQGFTNQIDAFEKCTGVFCKMLNHRSRMLPGSIKAFIAIIEKYKETKPILYCAEGHAMGGNFIECANIDEFVNSLSYWASWSAGTGVWKSDLPNLQGKEINQMFPHTVFLFGLHDESQYVIWNGRYEEMADDSGKGGYDVFHTFGVGFVDILNELRIRERISLKTFIKVKKDLYDFLGLLYINEVLLPTKHSYIIGDVKQSMSVYYGDYYYHRMICISYVKAVCHGIKRFIKRYTPRCCRHRS